jgi:PDZ domain-containing protein/trypsin-like peptidase
MRLAATVVAVCLALLVPDPAHAARRRSLETAVVDLGVTYQPWDQDRPWVKRQPQFRQALAAVVEGPLLLTSAQMVADATLIEVEKFGYASRVAARVVRVDPQIDLALLAVDTPGFFDGLVPVRLDTDLPTEGSVTSVRLKNRQLETSTSRVSRVEVQSSAMRSIEHLFLLVTTDLQGGGWSEPVFVGDRLAGLTVSQEEQQARILPASIVAGFLAMARETGPYAGFASLGLRWQVNEDPALTSYLGMTGPPRGILVTKVARGGSACGVLQERDILLSLDGHEIDSGGYYRHEKYGLLRMTNIPTEGHRAGETIPAEVWRDGARRRLDMKLRAASSEDDLEPDRRPDVAPAYAVLGGLVFRELDGPYLRSWGNDWRKAAPLQLQVWTWLFADDQAPDRRRVIILSSVLPHAYNLGYHDLNDVLVKAVNGRSVDTISDVIDAFAHPEGDFHRVELLPGAGPNEIILDAAAFDDANREILESYRVTEPLRREAPLPELGPECTAGRK